MDLDALSPQQQLEDVLALASHSRHNQTPSQMSPLNLMHFIKTIMSCISLKHQLPAIQQALLIHRTVSEATLHTIANILGLTSGIIETRLVKAPLSSHIYIREGEPFPGSVHISFYHASFIEFFLDQTRSEDYWLEDHRRYTALVPKVLHIFQDMYAMNEISHGMSFIPRQHFLL